MPPLPIDKKCHLKSFTYKWVELGYVLSLNGQIGQIIKIVIRKTIESFKSDPRCASNAYDLLNCNMIEELYYYPNNTVM